MDNPENTEQAAALDDNETTSPDTTTIEEFQRRFKVSDNEAAAAAGCSATMWRHFKAGGHALTEEDMRTAVSSVLKERAAAVEAA